MTSAACSREDGNEHHTVDDGLALAAGSSAVTAAPALECAVATEGDYCGTATGFCW